MAVVQDAVGDLQEVPVHRLGDGGEGRLIPLLRSHHESWVHVLSVAGARSSGPSTGYDPRMPGSYPGIVEFSGQDLQGGRIVGRVHEATPDVGPMLSRVPLLLVGQSNGRQAQRSSI